MLTFYDGNIPQIVAALEEKGFIFDKIIPKIKSPCFLTFNNSAIFSVNKVKFNEIFCELGMESFKNFIDKLKTLTKKSLTLSKTVLSERNNLNASVENLQLQLQIGFNKMISIRQTGTPSSHSYQKDRQYSYGEDINKAGGQRNKSI